MSEAAIAASSCFY